MSDHSAAVRHLFSLGKPAEGDWPDYLAGGLGAEHIPELIRLALDRGLFDRFPPEQTEGWAPIHAARALGQLRAAEAVAPLLGVLAEDREPGDWQQEDLPWVFARVGPPALPPVVAFLHDEARSGMARWSAAGCLVEMARAHPDARGECVTALSQALGRADRNPPELNTGLITCLVELKAVESAPVIERAYQVAAIDEGWCGSWEEVRQELGLGPAPAGRATPRARAQERARARRKDKRRKRKEA